jgi:hypothetical protein
MTEKQKYLCHTNKIKGRISIFDWLRDFLRIFSWWELWLVASLPALIVGVWLLFSFFLTIQNEVIRTVVTWSLLFTLTLGAATVDDIKKRRGR